MKFFFVWWVAFCVDLVLSSSPSAMQEEPAVQRNGLRGGLLNKVKEVALSQSTQVGITPPEAVNMNSWVALKKSLEKIAHQVRQVLLVRSDLGSLQEDLRTQESLWQRAESRLRNEVSLLDTRSRALAAEVSKGSGVHSDIENLQKLLQSQLDSNDAQEASFKFEKAQADIAEKRLHERINELNELLNGMRSKGQAEVQEYRDRGIKVQEQLVELERDVDAEKDGLVRSGSMLQQEVAAATANLTELTSQLKSLNATAEHMKAQIVPKSQIVQQLASMKAQLQEETRSIVRVQEEVTQVAAACASRRATIQQALREEDEKAKARRQEMLPFCNVAEQQRNVLEEMYRKSCGGNQSEAWAR